MKKWGGGWTVVLVRDGGSRSRSVRLGGAGAGLVAAGVVCLAAVFGGMGVWWARGRTDARVRDLEAEVASLRQQARGVGEVAGRLEEAETKYRRLQRIMSGAVSESKRDVRVPELPAEAAGGGPGEAENDAVPGVWPVAEEGFVTRSFNPDSTGPLGEHPGVDIAVPTGSYVRASGRGVVSAVGEDPVYGKFVRVDHGDGFATLYAHNAWLFVAEGDSVEQSEVVAVSGNTGRSSAPHLHFEILRNGRAVDPSSFVSGVRHSIR